MILPLSRSNAETPSTPTPLQALEEQLQRVLLGKEAELRLALCCLLAGGHLLLEDLPGTGKTTLAESLARSFGLAFRRVHFTNDLLPADLTGLSVLDQGSGSFRFHPGPLFTQVLLADEINRASPRTQSALLEAMASAVVSVEGTSHRLPQPFFVIATQNGLEQHGTQPLPESQLDRFLMRLRLGYPQPDAERALLRGDGMDLEHLQPLLSPEQLQALQRSVRELHAGDAALTYLLDLIHQSRCSNSPWQPLSPRASQGLLAVARSWAWLEGAAFITPEHIQQVFPAVAEHRLDGGRRQAAGESFSAQILQTVHGLR